MTNSKRNRRWGFDETKLRPGQREAAILLVEREFETDRSARKTKEEIAKEVGVSRQGMHKWETQDPNFIAYKNHLAADFFDTHLAFVYRKMLEGIDKGSMKGIELFLRRIGDLDRKDELTLRESGGGEESFEERAAALKARLGEKEDE